MVTLESNMRTHGSILKTLLISWILATILIPTSALALVIGNYTNSTGDQIYPQSFTSKKTFGAAVGDIDPGRDGLEIAVARHHLQHSAGSTLSIYYSDGTSASISSGEYIDTSIPALGDLDGNAANGLEIVYSRSNVLYAYYSNLSVYKSVSLTGFGYPPAIGDLDKDGSLEVIVADSNGAIEAFSSNLASLWSYSTGAIDTSPAFGDLDNDGDLEVIAAAKNGDVYVLYMNGSLYRKYSSGEALTMSAPAIGDIDNDGGLDVVLVTSSKVHAWKHSGDYLSGFPASPWGGSSNDGSSPALGDLDGDGSLEIVVGILSSGNTIYAINSDGTTRFSSSIDSSIVRSSPIIIDLNGGSGLETIVASTDRTGLKSKLNILDSSGNIVSETTLSGVLPEVYSNPAVADIDSDGNTEIIIATRDINNAQIYVLTTGESYDIEKAPWPEYHRDSSNTGIHSPMASITMPEEGGLFKREEAVQFNGTGLSIDGDITTYEWDFTDDGTYDYTDTVPTTNYSYSTSGNYTVRFRVTDSTGRSDTDIRNIRINYPPTAIIISPSDGAIIPEETQVTINGSGSDVEGSITDYYWTVDGRFIGDNSTFNTSFFRLGIRTINLTVTDELGVKSSVSVNVTVSERGIPTIIDIKTTVFPSVFDGKGVIGGDNLIDIMENLKHLNEEIYSFEDEIVPLASLYAANGMVVVSPGLAEQLEKHTPGIEERIIFKKGGDVYQEAVSYILENYPSFEDLIIVRGDLYFDSLAAAPLARVLRAPLLFVKPNEIPTVDKEILEKMGGTGRIYIIGGKSAVSVSVEEELAKHADSLIRIGGATRYETSAEIAKYIQQLNNRPLVISVSGSEPVYYAATLAEYYRVPIVYQDEPPIRKSTFKDHQISLGKLTVMDINPTGIQSISKENPIENINFNIKSTAPIKDAWMYIRTRDYDSTDEKWLIRLNNIPVTYNVHDEPITSYDTNQITRFDTYNLLKNGENNIQIEGTGYQGDGEFSISGVTIILVEEEPTTTEYWIKEGMESGSFEDPSFSSTEKTTLYAIYLKSSETSSLYFNDEKIYPLEKRGNFITIKEADVTGKITSKTNTYESKNVLTSSTQPIIILSLESQNLQIPKTESIETANIHLKMVRDYIFTNYDQIGMIYK